MKRSTLVLFFALALAAGACAQVTEAQDKPAAPAGPWGVSSSAGSMRNHAEWFPKMSAAGITTVRMFPEWRGVEPSSGKWQWEPTDALLKSAADNRLELNAILMGSAPATNKAHAFPMEHLPQWSEFVSRAVGRYGKQIRYWEVWNEGNAGFNDDHHTTDDYARLVAATSLAAKQANPEARIGLSVASFDAPYLHQTIRALAEQGHAQCFDFLCVHPYEIVDGLADSNGEIPFLWMTHTLRAAAPESPQAEIWLSEVSRRIEDRPDRVVTADEAASSLAKVYVMAIAQGIARTEWFEGQDPAGEDQGFGLLARDGSPRQTYRAIKQLTAVLGPHPKYLGWLALGAGDRGYGFVFQGAAGPVLACWMPRGHRDDGIKFESAVEVRDAALPGEKPNSLKTGAALELTDRPLLISGLPAKLVQQARANANHPFPWGGNFASATTITATPGDPAASRGIFQTQCAATPQVRFADDSTGILLRGDQGVGFYAHPSFADFGTRHYYVRVTVRRVAPGNLGMNLHYEVADSQGQAAYRNRGTWFGASESNDWQSFTWQVTDACFAKMWGFDFSIRPEQSVPFVLGKVEVSTQALK